MFKLANEVMAEIARKATNVPISKAGICWYSECCDGCYGTCTGTSYSTSATH